jgi:hypothetical protein
MKFKRYPIKDLIEFDKRNPPMECQPSEPHQVTKSSEEVLRELVSNYKALSKSIDAFIDCWAADENIRNRSSKRGNLCADLCGIRVNPIAFSGVIIQIEKETGLQALD